MVVLVVGQAGGLTVRSSRFGLLCLLAALRIVCLLGLLLCACFRLSLPLLGIHLLVKGTLFWFIVRASRGHRFALGTGGLKQSLLVGGIGPVYSLPKLCFKPFRRLSAVGFVLGWHREPLFNNNPAGAVFHRLL